MLDSLKSTTQKEQRVDIRYEIIQWITKEIRGNELTKAVQISARAVPVRAHIRVSKLDRFSKLDSLKSTTQKGGLVDIKNNKIQRITIGLGTKESEVEELTESKRDERRQARTNDNESKLYCCNRYYEKELMLLE